MKGQSFRTNRIAEGIKYCSPGISVRLRKIDWVFMFHSVASMPLKLQLDFSIYTNEASFTGNFNIEKISDWKSAYFFSVLEI